MSDESIDHEIDRRDEEIARLKAALAEAQKQPMVVVSGEMTRTPVCGARGWPNEEGYSPVCVDDPGHEDILHKDHRGVIFRLRPSSHLEPNRAKANMQANANHLRDHATHNPDGFAARMLRLVGQTEDQYLADLRDFEPQARYSPEVIRAWLADQYEGMVITDLLLSDMRSAVEVRFGEKVQITSDPNNPSTLTVTLD